MTGRSVKGEGHDFPAYVPFQSNAGYLHMPPFLLSPLNSGDQVMAAQRLIVAIGRIERALSRMEQLPTPGPSADGDLASRHDRLKTETRSAIAEIDRILAGKA